MERKEMNFPIEPHRAVGLEETQYILGVGTSLIYRLMRTDKKFPKGIKIGKARRWIASDLIAWLESKKKGGA